MERLAPLAVPPGGIVPTVAGQLSISPLDAATGMSVTLAPTAHSEVTNRVLVRHPRAMVGAHERTDDAVAGPHVDGGVRLVTGRQRGLVDRDHLHLVHHLKHQRTDRDKHNLTKNRIKQS